MNSADIHIHLSVESKLTLPEQYKLAWEHLTNPDPVIAANCKCWLTYRACDGEVTFEDWNKHVKPVIPKLTGEHDIHVRWMLSQVAAEIYLNRIHGKPEARLGAQHRFNELVMAGALFRWPPARLNWLKIQVLAFYAAHLNGQKIVHHIDGALTFWKSIVQATDWRKHPMAFATDLAGDCTPFRALMRLAHAEGVKGIPEAMGANFKSEKDPFVKALYAMGRGREGALWTREDDTPKPAGRLSLVDGLTQDDLFVELGVAKGDFAEAILKANPSVRYIGIDKWDDERHGPEEHPATMKRLLMFSPRAQLFRLRFDEASTLNLLIDEEAAVIYVDGYAHTGQEDGQTLRDWWPKVRPGGKLAGHDYEPERWPKTFVAVNKFAEEVGLPVHVIEDEPFDSWFIVKPE